jgi:hypothetical protein
MVAVFFKYYIYIFFFQKHFYTVKTNDNICADTVSSFFRNGWTPLLIFFLYTKNLEVVGRGDGTMVDWLDRVTHCVHGFGSKVEWSCKISHARTVSLWAFEDTQGSILEARPANLQKLPDILYQMLPRSRNMLHMCLQAADSTAKVVLEDFLLDW